MPNRQQILDAALDVIRERGITRATTREIARAAGCSEGSLYNHFDDKSQLVTCVLAECLPSFLPMLEAIPDRAGTGTVAGTLSELMHSAIAFYRELVPMVATTLADPELCRRHRAAVVEHGRGPHLAIEAVAGYLRREQHLGRLRPGTDPTAVAAVLVGACFHHAVLGLTLPAELHPIDEDTLVTHTISMLLDGLATGEVQRDA